MARKLTLEAIRSPEQLQRTINAVMDQIDSITTVVNEINTWAETLAAKLNADAGVTDTDYDATITAGQVSTSVDQTV